MTAPALAAGRFFAACGIGMLLGLFYGFLRPLRPRLTHLCDLIFVIAALYAWVYLGFGVCRGDLRLGYFAGLAVGGFLWEKTAGKWLRPVFDGMWKILAWPFEKIYGFFQKICKKLFAFRKKWVTIKWNNRGQKTRRNGGTPHGEKTRKAGISQPPGDHGHHSGAGDLRHRRSSKRAKLPG